MVYKLNSQWNLVFVRALIAALTLLALTALASSIGAQQAQAKDAPRLELVGVVLDPSPEQPEFAEFKVTLTNKGVGPLFIKEFRFNDLSVPRPLVPLWGQQTLEITCSYEGRAIAYCRTGSRQPEAFLVRANLHEESKLVLEIGKLISSGNENDDSFVKTQPNMTIPLPALPTFVPRN